MFTFSFFYYRVCKKWKECSRCPVLWKTVDVKFSWCGASQTKVAASFIENLPSCIMHLKLDFSLVFDNWVEQLDFEAFSSRLKEKCPRLRVLILHNADLSVSFPTAIDVCVYFFPSLQALAFRSCKFADSSVISDMCGCNIVESYRKQPFSKMSCLKNLYLVDNKNICINVCSLFDQDIAFMSRLEILNLHRRLISSRTFQALRQHASNLTELYLCENTRLHDSDLALRNFEFPCLKIICLANSFWISATGIVSLLQSCPSLQRVYVDIELAFCYAKHPAVASKQCRSNILAVSIKCPHF